MARYFRGWAKARERFQFVVVKLFDSLEAVKRFAGPGCAVPVLEPEARKLRSKFEPVARHCQVRVEPVAHGEENGDGDPDPGCRVCRPAASRPEVFSG